MSRLHAHCNCWQKTSTAQCDDPNHDSSPTEDRLLLTPRLVRMCTLSCPPFCDVLPSAETQVAIAKQGAIEPLIALLDGEGEGRSPEYAAAALAELASIPANKASIDRGGGIQPLVALLSDSRRQIDAKKYTAAALARISAEERVKKSQKQQERERQEQLQKAGEPPKASKAEVIADAGAIAPLVDLLSGSMGEGAQEEAAGALLALAENEGNRTAITLAGGIGGLVLLLGCPNGKARQHAEGALVRLSFESANRKILREGSALQQHLYVVDMDASRSRSRSMYNISPCITAKPLQRTRAAEVCGP